MRLRVCGPARDGEWHEMKMLEKHDNRAVRVFERPYWVYRSGPRVPYGRRPLWAVLAAMIAELEYREALA